MSEDADPSKPRDETCKCSDFEAAQDSGTDNEGYGPLLSCPWEAWRIGSDLPDINFCPWCGKPVPLAK